MAYKGSEEDRRFVALSAGELDDYLSSEVLLWRMNRIDLPLTPGNLLLAVKRLSVVNDPALGVTIDQTQNLIDRRRTAWGKKVDKELAMRMNQWREQVEEITRYGSIDASFTFQVRSRVILELLLTEKRYPDEHIRSTVENADNGLFFLTKPGEFLWDENLMDLFPKEAYPYLYIKDKRQP